MLNQSFGKPSLSWSWRVQRGYPAMAGLLCRSCLTLRNDDSYSFTYKAAIP